MSNSAEHLNVLPLLPLSPFVGGANSTRALLMRIQLAATPPGLVLSLFAADVVAPCYSTSTNNHQQFQLSSIVDLEHFPERRSLFVREEST